MPDNSRQAKLAAKLSSADFWLWETIDDAQAGRSTPRLYQRHNQACAAQAKFYRFRLAAIEANAPGALALRSVTVTGTDRDGNLFRTNKRDAPGPFCLIWECNTSSPIHTTDVNSTVVDPREVARIQQELDSGDLSPIDAGEEYLSKAYGIPLNKNEDGTPGLAPSRRGSLEISPCPPHDFDEGRSPMCLKCYAPDPDLLGDSPPSPLQGDEER